MVGLRASSPGCLRTRRRPVARRACELLSVARSTLHYESRLVERDAPVVAVMREFAPE